MSKSSTCAELRKDVSASHTILDDAGIPPAPTLTERVQIALERIPPSWEQVNELLRQLRELTDGDTE
jgi:hypothetical protein